ncbi:hypothetical protein BJF92_09280 [Rhizobium rhizosphaerae]|uniref:Uncharacterized protein n=1 Tax=Xaviernesmea rhizosphaerae TaxID=1672749 RepID=A0A1Q9AGD8_9HYPH|nr:hypothetical protein [Xaviernesmea rhizosphaerae]OLP53941.1 hypothetical protein BJF92_09280 [Xaviernesmea rhizosphaerae]
MTIRHVGTLLLLLLGCLAIPTAAAAVQPEACPAAFPASAFARPAEARDVRPCAQALLSILFRRLPPPPETEIHVVDTLYGKDEAGAHNAFITFQIATPNRRRLCRDSAEPADMQVNFVRDPVDGWIDLDSRGSYDPAACGQWTYWADEDIAEILHPPHFTRLPAAQRAGIREVAKGDPERKAILDAVREANADLNRRTPIVFVVGRLRSDGETAYFRGAVRRKLDGRPIDPALWGECEQDPETAVLEALLEKNNGRWHAIKANRCADDLFLTGAERSRYRLFLMDE